MVDFVRFFFCIFFYILKVTLSIELQVLLIEIVLAYGLVWEALVYFFFFSFCPGVTQGGPWEGPVEFLVTKNVMILWERDLGGKPHGC